MLLVIDVGNTNITLGVYKKEKLEAKFRMTTKLPRTSDEYGISLCDLIEHQGFEIRQIDAIRQNRLEDAIHYLKEDLNDFGTSSS